MAVYALLADVRHYNREHLQGVYSTLEKAQQAATGVSTWYSSEDNTGRTYEWSGYSRQDDQEWRIEEFALDE